MKLRILRKKIKCKFGKKFNYVWNLELFRVGFVAIIFYWEGFGFRILRFDVFLFFILD